MSGADTQVNVILVTAPDAEVGARLARELVRERLAACVNLVDPIRSIYRWEGEIHDDREVLLVIKTSRARREALTARVCELHPYDLPEVLALPAVGGSRAYLDWVCAESTG